MSAPRGLEGFGPGTHLVGPPVIKVSVYRDIMNRGHSIETNRDKTDYMLKNVYQHTIREREIEFANIIDARMLAFMPNSSANASANEN